VEKKNRNPSRYPLPISKDMYESEVWYCTHGVKPRNRSKRKPGGPTIEKENRIKGKSTAAACGSDDKTIIGGIDVGDDEEEEEDQSYEDPLGDKRKRKFANRGPNQHYR
jgi:hypothetical protein